MSSTQMCHTSLNRNRLYYGIYRNFAKKPSNSSKKAAASSGGGRGEPSSQPPPPPPPQGDPDIQHIPKSESGQLSTFVVIKEKTQETFSVLYIVGILFCCVPYTFYLVFTNLFGSSGSSKLRNDTFDLVREDSRVLRLLGNDIIASQASHDCTFTDDEGHERVQLIYEVQGSKGKGRVDVEMLKEDKDWRMQYCMVTTPYSVISIVDNRSLYA